MRLPIPPTFQTLQAREDVLERIDAFLLTPGRFNFKAPLGKTNWSRPITLYSRYPIKGISYSPK